MLWARMESNVFMFVPKDSLLVWKNNVMTHHRYDSYNWMATKRLQEYSLEFQQFLGATGCKTSLPVGRLVVDHTQTPRIEASGK
jgi:hypothetical protein